MCSLFTTASPSLFSLSPPPSLPQKLLRPQHPSSHVLNFSEEKLHRTARRALFALYLSTTASFALHSTESNRNISSYIKPFSVAVARRTALLFYFTLHLRWRGKCNGIQWQLKLPASCLKFSLILSCQFYRHLFPIIVTF